MMNDIKLEKCIEAAYGQVIEAVPIKSRKTCPALLAMTKMFENMKDRNNKEIALELGLIGHCGECRKEC